LGGADFEGLYYRSRSNSTQPQAVMQVGAGGGHPTPTRGSRGITPGGFFIFMCPYVRFRMPKRYFRRIKKSSNLITYIN